MCIKLKLFFIIIMTTKPAQDNEKKRTLTLLQGYYTYGYFIYNYIIFNMII